MARAGSKKNRSISISVRKQIEKISDVTLSEFADSNKPSLRGRQKKNKNIYSQVRQISTSEDVVEPACVDEPEEEEQICETFDTPVKPNTAAPVVKSVNNEYAEIPLHIWYFISEYMRPEDVKSFSLICKNTLSIVNNMSFWIRLYKRYYKNKKLPKCLNNEIYPLVPLCLKQKVVRSLYYFYEPYSSQLVNNMISKEELIGMSCLFQGIHISQEKHSDDEKRWVYTFKLSCKSSEDLSKMQKMSGFDKSSKINYNPEVNCRLLKITCKEFIFIPNVRGMKLTRMESLSRSTIALKFCCVPNYKANNDIGTVTINLDNVQKPMILPWWHRDYWNHSNCCSHYGQLKIDFNNF